MLFVGVLAWMNPLAVSAADTLLVIGDSIAVGTASALSPTKTSAVVGANSKTIAGFAVSGTYTQMVISAGSNDKGQNFTTAQQQSYLKAIRDKQPNAKTVWILPYDAAMKAVVRSVAASYGDSTVDLSQFSSADGLHPKSYSSLASSVKTALGSTAAASASGSNAATGSGAEETAGTVSGDSISGLIPCGNASIPCTLCHFITGIANLITTIRDVMFFIGLAVITAMAIVYIVSGGDQKLMTLAKDGIKYTLIGILFILFAWFIVETVMFNVLNARNDLGVGAQFRGVDGYQFNCDATSRSGEQVETYGSSALSTQYNTSVSVSSNAKCSDMNAALMADVNAAGYGVPPALLVAFMRRECAPALTNPNACSSNNSYTAGGPMQFTDSTWKGLGCTGSKFNRADALKCAAKFISKSSGGDYSVVGIYKAGDAYCGSCVDKNACGGNYCAGIVANYDVYKNC